MTKAELSEFIKSEVAPLIAKAAPDGKAIAELVRENVEASLKEARKSSGGYASRMFAGEEADKPKLAPGTAFARCLRATAAAKMMGEGPAKALEILKQWGDVELADKWAAAREKALGSGDPTAGGFLVPPQFSSDVIELLRPAAVVRSLGPQSIPMPTGSVNVPKITQGATASYVGENTNISKTEERFGQIKLTFKKQACLVPISNDLIRYSSPSADAVVRDDVVRAMATREDKAFIRDDGTSGTPKGLKYWINSANKLAANGTVSLANVTTDLGRLVQAIMAADIPLIVQQNQGSNGAVLDVRPGWIMSPRTYRYLTTVQTTTGAYAYRDEMLRGTLWGWPFRVTTQVLETQTAGGADTGGNQSELYFGAFAHAVIGEALGVMVDASQEAAYNDGSSVVAAFSQDQTVVRVIAEHDFALRHDRAFALLQNMTWGV